MAVGFNSRISGRMWMQMQRCACSDTALQRPASSALRVSAMPEGASRSMLRGAGTSESGDEPGVTAAVDNSAAEGRRTARSGPGWRRSRLAACACPLRRRRRGRYANRGILMDLHVLRIALHVPFVDQPRWLFAEQMCRQEKQRDNRLRLCKHAVLYCCQQSRSGGLNSYSCSWSQAAARHPAAQQMAQQAAQQRAHARLPVRQLRQEALCQGARSHLKCLPC